MKKIKGDGFEAVAIYPGYPGRTPGPVISSAAVAQDYWINPVPGDISILKPATTEYLLSRLKVKSGTWRIHAAACHLYGFKSQNILYGDKSQSTDGAFLFVYTQPYLGLINNRPVTVIGEAVACLRAQIGNGLNITKYDPQGNEIMHHATIENFIAIAEEWERSGEGYRMPKALAEALSIYRPPSLFADAPPDPHAKDKWVYSLMAPLLKAEMKQRPAAQKVIDDHKEALIKAGITPTIEAVKAASNRGRKLTKTSPQ